MDFDTSILPSNILTYLETTNISTSEPGDDLDIFFHCWIKQDCPSCLSPASQYPCSWCAISQACVPNTVYGYPFGILSPLRSSDICPSAWRERWEMRARPFSCRCSSMTFISVVVAVLATMVTGLLIYLGIKLGMWIGRKWRGRKEGWWRVRVWTPRWTRRRHEAGCQTEPAQQGGDDTIEQVVDERTSLLA